MLTVGLGDDHTTALTLLCLGSHSDDIEIGAGGTILRLLQERPDTRVHWVIFSADDAREAEARASAADFLAGAASFDVIVHDFRESYFPAVIADLKDAFEELRARVSPDVIVTHHRRDDHQDHRTVAELTWNSFRNHLVLEYEIPKYEGDLGHPNLYVPLSTSTATRKVELLMQHFGTQGNKRWFRPETFRAVMALRAVECNAADGWAEAFHARKLVL
jgi:LmbE family N-acetylglucosaminyl deacetylase